MSKVAALLFLMGIFASSFSFAETCEPDTTVDEFSRIMCLPWGNEVCQENSLLGGHAYVEVIPQGNNWFGVVCWVKYCHQPGYINMNSFTYRRDNCGGNFQSVRATENYKDPCPFFGSIIQVDGEVIGETIPLTGINFDLNYFSNRVVGRTSDYSVNSNLTRDIIPGVSGNKVEVFDADDNLVTSATYPNIEHQTHVFTWNGLDSVGQETWGPATFNFKITEIRPTYDIHAKQQLSVGSLKVKKLGLGGWAPSVWQFFDNKTGLLYKGDGGVRTVKGAVAISSGWRVAEEEGALVHEFDSVGRIVKTRTGITGGEIRSFSYNGSGQLSAITELGGLVSTFTYTSGKISAITSPYGKVTTLTTDTNGYLKSVKDPQNAEYEMTYLTGGLLHTFKKPNAAVSTMSYTADGRLTQDSHSGGYFATLARVAGTVTDFRKQFTTKMGRTTYVENTPIQAPYERRAVTSPDGMVTNLDVTPWSLMEWNSAGIQSRSWGDDQRFGTMSRQPYQIGNHLRTDSYDRNIALSDPSNPFSISSWTEKITTGSNFELNKVYDPVTRTWTSTSKLGKTSELTTDAYERVTSQKVGNLTATNYAYTGSNLTGITQGARATVLNYSNTTGLLTSIVNALSQTTGFVYDSVNRLSSVVLPDSRVISYGYDSIGRMTSITPSGKPVHSFAFDLSENLKSYEAPALAGLSSTKMQYLYNDDNQLTRIIRPDSSIIYFDYSASTGKIISARGGPVTKNYIMGPVNPIKISTSKFELNIDSYYKEVVGETLIGLPSYSQIWRYTRELNPYYGYVTSDNLIADDWNVINYSYNDDEDLVTAGNLSLEYNIPNGQLTGTTLGNVTDSYTYNSFGEVLTYTAKYSGVTKYSATYTRDNLGRIISKNEIVDGAASGLLTYFYDSSGRLIEVKKNGVTISLYGYDGNNNRTSALVGGVSIAATYDNQDRLKQYGIFDYTYRPSGDHFFEENTLTYTSQTTVFDMFGGLIKVTTHADDIIQYEVDPQNRRVSRKLNGALTNRYAYMGSNIVGEINPSGALTRRYVYASKKNIPDYYIQGSTEYRIISDHLGSPRLIINASTGAIVYKMIHDEFGRVTTDTNPGYIPFGFAGGTYDYQTGLVRFGARDYDPEIGRWLSKDPILFNGQDTNLYGYVMNDPVNLIDPSGLIFQETFARYLSPNQQIALGTAMAAIGTRVAIAGAMSVNPAVFAFGLALGMEGAANFNHARTRGAPEFDVFDRISRSIPQNPPNSCSNASR